MGCTSSAELDARREMVQRAQRLECRVCVLQKNQRALIRNLERLSRTQQHLVEGPYAGTGVASYLMGSMAGSCGFLNARESSENVRK